MIMLVNSYYRARYMLSIMIDVIINILEKRRGHRDRLSWEKYSVLLQLDLGYIARV